MTKKNRHFGQNNKSWFRKPIKKRYFFVLVIISFLVCVAIFYFYSLFAFTKEGYKSSEIGRIFYLDIKGMYLDVRYPIPIPLTIVPYIKPTDTPAPTSLPWITAEYVSSNLGVSFHYSYSWPGGGHFYVREIGDKIYLYNGNFDQPILGSDDEFFSAYKRGTIGYKYLEVFSKDPKLSLIGAIKEKILPNVSPNDCTVTLTGSDGPREIPSVQRAIIRANIPKVPNLTLMDVRSYQNKCNPQYVYEYGGVNYFIMDPKHPDKFIFVSVGEDDIPSGYKGYMWDGSIIVSPTPTPDPNQIIAVYHYYVHVSSTTSMIGLQLSQSNAGLTFTEDIGTLFIINFGQEATLHKFYVSSSSPQDIFTDPNPNPKQLPGSFGPDTIGALRIYHAGTGTIQVVEAK